MPKARAWRVLACHALPPLRAQCGRYNRKLLDAAVKLVRPGGRVVLSTCTISPYECEVSVRYVLDHHPFMRLVPAEPRVGGLGLEGCHPSGGLQHALRCSAAGGPEGAEQWLRPEEARLVQRFDPDGPEDTQGFFVAAFEKARSCL